MCVCVYIYIYIYIIYIYVYIYIYISRTNSMRIPFYVMNTLMRMVCATQVRAAVFAPPGDASSFGTGG